MIYLRNERGAWNAKFHLSYNILLPRRVDFWLPSPLPQRLYGREIVRWRHKHIFLDG